MTVARIGLPLVLVDRPQPGLGAVPGDLHGALLAFAPALVLCRVTGTRGTETGPAWRRQPRRVFHGLFLARLLEHRRHYALVATILDL
jgi:hypothetical protein